MVFPKRLLLFFTPDGTASIDHGGMVDRLEAERHRDRLHVALDPRAARAVQVQDRHPVGLKMSAGGAGQEHAFGMSGLWSGATLHEPSGDANFDGGNGQRTGWGSGPSIDQIIAQRNGPQLPVPARGRPTRCRRRAYRTLELGAQCADPHSMHRMIYKGDNQPIHPEINPLAAFNRLFPANSGTPAMPMQQTNARKKAQLDALMLQVEKLRTRVGTRRAPQDRRAPERPARDGQPAHRRRPPPSAARARQQRLRRRWCATKTARRSAPTPRR